MTNWNPRANDLFLKALELRSDDERQKYLDEACIGDGALRDDVESLLEANARAGSFLESPAPASNLVAAVDGPSLSERPGTSIGPYKLLEQIGEGGFGVVFMAEQIQSVRRKVALKVIKPGMDTRQVIARFEAERQALALMDHPNIAKVLDAGETLTGRPYFVMDLVRGIPITEYCDQAQLTPRQRLDLFVSLCQAVQHAHQKGIIHRDLKPTNVLLTLQDGVPVVKVIDFGVAKAMGQQLTEKTLFTGFAQMLGTPLYMAPEQTNLSNIDVDTRCDIYSLGVLLYELLTGTTPFDKERLKDADYDQLRRIIREEEPPRPSTRISTLAGATQTVVAAQRKTDPKRLSQMFRGELDWIVMKALEKDRNRRYETASALAADVQRYLNDEPVMACPPSAGYRLRKLVRRYRWGVAAAATVFLVLLGGIVGTTLGLIQADRHRARAVLAAEAERQAKIDAQQAAAAERLARESAQKRLGQIERGNEILGSIFQDVDPRNEITEGKSLRVLLSERLREAVAKLDAEAVGDPVAVARLQLILGKSLYGLGYAAQAIPLFANARATFAAQLGPDHTETLNTMDHLALAYTAVNQNELALPLHEESLRLAKARYGPDSQATLMIMHNLASGYRGANKLDLAIPLLEETLKHRKATLGVDNPHTLQTMNNLGLLYVEAHKLDLAIPMLEETVRLRRARWGSGHVDVLNSVNNLAMAYQAAGKLDLALPRFEEVVRLIEAKLPPDHPHVLIAKNNLAFAYRTAGKLDQALPLAEQAALGLEKRKFEHEDAYKIIATVIDCHEQLSQFEQADAWRHKWLLAVKKQSGADSVPYAWEQWRLAYSLLLRKKWGEAESAFRGSLVILQKQMPDVWTTFNTQSLLGATLVGQKKYADAEPLLTQAYEGMKQRKAEIPLNARKCLTYAAKQLVQLYEAWGKPEKAAEWRKELEAERDRQKK
jgi:serine/threonine protein kinase